MKHETLTDEEHEAKRALESGAFLDRALLAFDVLRKAGIECDGNDTEGKIKAAIKKLFSTPEGAAWVKERIKNFPD